MKTYLAILLISILLAGFTNCGSSKNAGIGEDSNVKLACKAFVKTICTKDTLAFYGLVNKEALAHNLNQWIKTEKPISEEDLYFPFFFVYSPLKISQKVLFKNRNREVFFKEFKIDKLEHVSDSIVQVRIRWIENLPGATSSDIHLTLQGKEEWKVINARWKTL